MKTQIENTFDAVLEHLKGLDESELLTIHNEYCQQANYTDDEVFYNDNEFFEMYFADKVLDAIRAVCYGEYEYTDEYVKFNGYGNIESSNYLDDLIDIDELAQYVLENPYDFDIELQDEDDYHSGLLYGVDNKQ